MHSPDTEPGAGLRPELSPPFIRLRMVENAQRQLPMEDGTVATIALPSSYEVRDISTLSLSSSFVKYYVGNPVGCPRRSYRTLRTAHGRF